jgi:predicted secreted protein
LIFSLVSWLAVYFVVWWTALFVVLPFGVRSQSDAGEISPGTEPGAPTVTRVFRVVVINTIVASVIFAGIFYVLTQTDLTLDDVPFLPKFDRTG